MITVVADAVMFARHPGKPRRNVFPRRLASNASCPYKFAYARTALKYGLNSVGIGYGDSLLVPELICESLIEPLGELGVRPLYYPISSTLELEWNGLRGMITGTVKALLVVHYFGQPQPIAACRDFCRSHSLILIEDNAHGFGGTYDGQRLGTFGDIGVTAPRKTFPVMNGAYLYLANSKSLDLPDLQLQPLSASSIKQSIRHYFEIVPAVSAALDRRRTRAERRRRLGPPPKYGSQEAFRDPPLVADYGMDESTHEYLMCQDIAGIQRKRQQIYEIWQRWAESQGLTPVFPELLPGAMPLVFPAFTDSADASLTWFERGHRAGVDIHSWPTLPQCMVERNGRAMRLWERMVCFPIHQEMSIHALETVLQRL